MNDMFGKMQEMQEKMQENLKKAKESLDLIKVETQTGGGMVKVTANANKKILKIQISEDLMAANDPEMMEDLICAAVNRAIEEAELKGKEELAKATSGILPNIPGIDLSKFGL